MLTLDGTLLLSLGAGMGGVTLTPQLVTVHVQVKHCSTCLLILNMTNLADLPVDIRTSNSMGLPCTQTSS